ncbi:PAS domain-containing protein [Streptomonospora nanhaiensis]|uniref:PAS domain-containing protein n=1 Tax=Streptomonospora nanhaiensis TaxID=1323731 RepID=A0ABY6YKG8_9ACTN|nr:PAS domain-containing protein [Streptomonospora nanhaiensis]WAE72824.1 PAS domain-containing protein [Streptomonospora nanhaiensis]
MSENLAGLQRETTALSERTAALRNTHTMYPDDAEGTAEAALAELEYAERLLNDAGAQLARAHSQPGPRRQNDDDRNLLRAVFTELSVPVVLLDHEGYIRRINNAGAAQLGSAPGYLTGKTFAHFVDLRKRAAMQSWLAAVLRGGGPASLESRLAQRGWAEDVHLTLTRLELPTEPNPLVLVAMSPPMNGAEEEAPSPLEPEVEDQVVVLAARRLDVLTRMTRLLLRSAGPGGAGEPLALADAAELLADSYADWVVVDVCDLPTDPGVARRAVVAGPPDAAPGVREEVAAVSPGGSEIPGEVLGRGQSLLFPLIEDESVLGAAGSGAPLLAVLGAGSLLSVPLRGSRGVRGALTLIRRSNRSSFRLADLGLIEEIGEHIGLALPPRPVP